jgi:hypothetical protein
MTKPGTGAENKNALNKGDQGLRKGEPRKVTTTQGAIYEVMRPEVKGPSYPLLKPEVKETLDKIVYQLDLIKNTVGLLETRITQNENQLSTVMESIKTDDMNFRAPITKATVLVDTVANQMAPIPSREDIRRENWQVS